MFDPKIRVSRQLIERLKLAAEMSGCATLEEFASHALEEAAEKVLSGAASASAGGNAASAGDVEAIARKLKGLGYIE